MRWATHVARMAERRVAYRDLVGKPVGKGSLGKPRHRCEYTITRDLKYI
jgi:hypothetical protein